MTLAPGITAFDDGTRGTAARTPWIFIPDRSPHILESPGPDSFHLVSSSEVCLSSCQVRVHNGCSPVSGLFRRCSKGLQHTFCHTLDVIGFSTCWLSLTSHRHTTALPCLCAQVISSQTADVEIKAKAATEKEENLKTESTQISLDKVRHNDSGS